MKNKILYNNILETAKILAADIRKLPIENIPVHESVKSYFRFDLGKLDYVSECNAFMLYHCVEQLNAFGKNTLIVDHGAGIGFFAMLVERMGWTSICHDISNEYMEGIKILGKQLSAEPRHYVVGDTDALIHYCLSSHLQPNALASRNVIEHLPDYAIFFRDLMKISSPGFSVVITTSANEHHPIVKWIHKKIHHQFENIGSNTDMDNPTLNSKSCGVLLRRDIISRHFPQFSEDKMQHLAQSTRGLMEASIIESVQNYIHHGIHPSPIPHPTNTRDPYNGVWVERLVPISDYEKAALQAGFAFQALMGFYNEYYSKVYKNVLTRILNFIIRWLPAHWVACSPFLAMKLSIPISKKT